MENVVLISVGIISFLRLRLARKAKDTKIVSFFHPNAAGRGGGERVLWAAIAGLVSRSDVKKIVVYSLESDREVLFRSRTDTFKITTPDDSKIVFRKLRFGSLLEPKTYPIAAIFGQSLGSIVVLLSGLFTTPLSD